MSLRAILRFLSCLSLLSLISIAVTADVESNIAVSEVNVAPGVSSQQVLRVGMPLPGQIPFFWQDADGEFQGIYADTLRLIAEDLQVELDFVPLSQARLQRLFIAGEIDIEAGVSPQLEVPDTLQQVSLYSVPFGIVNEVIIYRPELSFPVFILKDLEGRRVATVRGASVPDDLIREDFASQWQIAQRVHRGWNQIGLINEATALRYQLEEQLNYEISLPYASNAVTFRLHRAQETLLQSLNESIARLEQQGELERLVCKYRCGTQ